MIGLGKESPSTPVQINTTPSHSFPPIAITMNLPKPVGLRNSQRYLLSTSSHQRRIRHHYSLSSHRKDKIPDLRCTRPR